MIAGTYRSIDPVMGGLFGSDFVVIRVNTSRYHQLQLSANMGLLGKSKGGGRKNASNAYFGLTGGWLTFWVSVACSTDMTLFGYDQGVFGEFGIN